MEIKTDILLKGSDWNTATNNMSSIFPPRPNYSLYMLCLAIGIMYDKIIESPTENGEDVKSVPRNVLQNNDNGKLDFYFQAAILSTRTLEISEEERLNLAFGENTDFNKIAFLTRFANFGVTKLVELIGDTELETMENIKNFLVSTVEGRNFDIYSLPGQEIIELENN